MKELINVKKEKILIDIPIEGWTFTEQMWINTKWKKTIWIQINQATL